LRLIVDLKQLSQLRNNFSLVQNVGVKSVIDSRVGVKGPFECLLKADTVSFNFNTIQISLNSARLLFDKIENHVAGALCSM
jgi:hypothetical protein